MALIPANTTFEDVEKNLSARQIRAVAALVEGNSYVAAAEKSEVSLASIKRWIVEPDFKAAIAFGRKQAFDSAVSKLSNGCSLAVDTLVEIAANGQSEQVRVRASEVILNTTVKVAELSQLQDRIGYLEGLLSEP